MRRQQVAVGCEHLEHPERGWFIVRRKTDLVVVVCELVRTQPCRVESKGFPGQYRNRVKVPHTSIIGYERQP